MSERSGSTIEMTCGEIEDLLPLHVLGLLDAEESSAIEAHLPLCPSCSAAAMQFEAVTGALPLALEPIQPEPASRDALMARIAAPAKPEAVVTPISSRAARSGRWGWLAAAAILLLVIGGGGVAFDRVTDERDDAMHDAAMLEEFVSPSTVAMTLERMPESQYDDGWGSSRLLKNPDGAMMIVVEGCPPTTDDRSYPVWVAMGDHRMPVGDIVVGPDGSGWMEVTFPNEMPEPEMVGVSMSETDAGTHDLFLGEMVG